LIDHPYCETFWIIIFHLVRELQEQTEQNDEKKISSSEAVYVYICALSSGENKVALSLYLKRQARRGREHDIS